MKDKIRRNFNRAAKTYDQHCVVQNAICQRSVQLLFEHQTHFHNIADFACGTGESTRSLTHSVNFKKCYAVDLAERLLSTAKNKLANISNIDWILGDFEHQIHMQSLDLIFCNMGLHWTSDFSATIHLWQQYLNRNGLLLFSIPMVENFPEIKKSCKPKFLSHKQVIKALLENHWQLISSEIRFFEVRFNSQIEALKSLKAMGTNYNKIHVQRAQGLSSIKLNQIFLNPNSKNLTYQIGIYLARKII